MGGKAVRNLRAGALGVVCAALGTVAVFALFYLLSGYHYLLGWYLGLGDCIYKQESFTKIYFTTATKHAGNGYCAAALIVCGILLPLCISKLLRVWRGNYGRAQWVVSGLSVIYTLLLLCGCTGLWCWGYGLAHPAFDEVFSAQNVAAIHPFQGISYYMLPNNHLLYNFVNNLFSRFFSDSIFSGRLLSLAFYCAFGVGVFHALCRFTGKKTLSFLLALALISQFFVWGFSFQARGYELYLLFETGLVVSLFSWLRTGHKKWLFINAACAVCGYFCMPSFLYLHAAQLAFAVIYQLINRNFQPAFWKYQAAALGVAFLCITPALCFSGYDSMFNNIYVAPMSKIKTTAEFCSWMFPYFMPYVNHIFSDVVWHGTSFGLLLSVTPLALLLSGRRSRFFAPGLFYAVMWAVFLAMAIVMHRLPFERNLIGHYSISWAFFLVTIYWLSAIVKRLPGVITTVVPAVVAVLFIYHFIATNRDLLQYTPYEYDVNTVYLDQQKCTNTVPAGSVVYCSDESFYFGYFCRKKGCVVHHCPTGTEPYYIKLTTEAMLPVFASRYRLDTTINDYEVYRWRGVEK